MAALRNCLKQLGCSEVATYIQSGNAVCTVPSASVAALPDGLSAALASEFALKVSVTVRTQTELQALVAAQPFHGKQGALDTMHVVFLAAPLASDQLARLQAKRTGEEQIVGTDRELHLWLPHGFGRSRLAAECTAAWVPGCPTVRNWKTVLQLRTMLEGP